jgi:MerR HTH family regulatory protein
MKQSMTFNIQEAAYECKISSDSLKEFIQYEWIRPVDPINLLLDEEDLARIELIEELQEKLGANHESIPVILHLIDQLKNIHIKLSTYDEKFN